MFILVYVLECFKGENMDNFFVARDNMIKGQVLPNKITDAALLKVISHLPRQSFVPEHYKTVSYSDESIPLGSGRGVFRRSFFLKII
jgi:protein-L-isoaspartate O-methyltransferase